MQRENKCNIKEPHSHLVAGRTFECEKGVQRENKTMEERFDERFGEHKSGKNSIGIQYIDAPELVLKSFIQSEIDLARAEDRGAVENIIDGFKKEIRLREQGTLSSDIGKVVYYYLDSIQRKIKNLITNKDE